MMLPKSLESFGSHPQKKCDREICVRNGYNPMVEITNSHLYVNALFLHLYAAPTHQNMGLFLQSQKALIHSPFWLVNQQNKYIIHL